MHNKGEEKQRYASMTIRIQTLVKVTMDHQNYLELVYFVTAFVPSETACFASSPGRIKRTAVWISREEIVDLLLY